MGNKDAMQFNLSGGVVDAMQFNLSGGVVASILESTGLELTQ